MFTILTKREQECVRKAFKALDMDKYYEVSKGSVKIILSGVPYIVISKTFKIDKHICFGYGYNTSQNAAETSAYDVKSYEGFVKYQLKQFDNQLERYSDWLKEGEYRWIKPCLSSLSYLNKDIPELEQIVLLEKSDKNDFTSNDVFKSNADIEANIEDIIEILKIQRSHAEKAVEAYYKRYGTENINTWTYDREN